MTAAVLDRGHPAAAWRATLRGPVPATLLFLLATAVLATGAAPRRLVLPGSDLDGVHQRISAVELRPVEVAA